jgi:hypothetical protein
MDINKVNWTNSKEKINMAFPIAKVNKDKRTVSGFATLDNIDRHGDIVTPDASEKAFNRFRGNLREMHQPIAVGKVVSFETQDFIDKETGKSYKGIYVDAYISKGAQDTWEKVLDGTLTGFSIGGNIVEASYEPGDSKDDTRVIKDYELMELSLVDNPANPLATIFSIHKNEDGILMKGMATEITVENVFWCKNDQMATTSEIDNKDCVICGDPMSTIGWVESSDVTKSETVKKFVQAQFKKDDAGGPTHAATTRDGDAATNSNGTIDSNETINTYPDQNPIKKADSLSTGDFVKWGSSGGTAYGKITKIVKNGSYKVPDSSFTINGDEEDPAAVIKIYKKTEKGFVPTDKIVGHKLSTLTKIKIKVNKSIDEKIINKGGNEMADETNLVEAAPVEEVAEEAVVEVFETVEEEAVEKAATVSELPVDELDFAKMVDGLKVDLENAIKKNYVDATNAAQDVQKSVDDFNLNIQKSIDDFGSKITDLSNNVAEVTHKLLDLQKRVDSFESATAVKKSGEVEQASTDNNKITKSIWNGHFLNARDL